MTNTVKSTIGLVGKKCGMTRVYTDGVAIPVTVIQVLPNRVTQVKTVKNDGYSAIQVTSGVRKSTHLTKSEIGHFSKAGVEPGDGLWEFRALDSDVDGAEAKLKVGSELKVDLFAEGQYVDVIGVTKGKGFAGVIKKYHFSSQDATHGNSLSHRAPGSIGQRQSPGKVFKGKKMCGHMGDKKQTILSQKVVRVDLDRNLVLVRGAIPGGENGYVVIRPAVKKSA